MSVLIGGIELDEEDADRLKELVKDAATKTAYEIKQQAWELALEGVRSDFDKSWCKKFIDSFPEGTEHEKAYLLDRLLDIYVAFKHNRLTQEQAKERTEFAVQMFITGFYNASVEG